MFSCNVLELPINTLLTQALFDSKTEKDYTPVFHSVSPLIRFFFAVDCNQENVDYTRESHQLLGRFCRVSSAIVTLEFLGRSVPSNPLIEQLTQSG